MSGVMSEKDMSEFLSRKLIARIATVNKECKPHVAPVWFIYENGKIFITTGKNSVKVRNIRTNPYIAVTIDETEHGLNNRGVIMEGKAEFSDDDDIARKIFTKYLGSIEHPNAKKLLQIDRVVIVLKPEKIITWDFRERE